MAKCKALTGSAVKGLNTTYLKIGLWWLSWYSNRSNYFHGVWILFIGQISKLFD